MYREAFFVLCIGEFKKIEYVKPRATLDTIFFTSLKKSLEKVERGSFFGTGETFWAVFWAKTEALSF